MSEQSKKRICGAKARTTGKLCQNTAVMANGRCRMHGGKSTGAPPEKLKGNTNRATPGSPRSKFLDAAQQKRLTELQTLSDVDLLKRAMLIGMLKAEGGETRAINAMANAYRAKIVADDREADEGQDRPTISDEPMSEEEWEAEYGVKEDVNDLEATEGTASGTG